MPNKATKTKKRTKVKSKAKPKIHSKPKRKPVKKVAKPKAQARKVVVKQQVIHQVIKPKPTYGKLKFKPPANEWFVLMTGKEIKTLRDFAYDLGVMEDVVFYHHVNDDRNDFVSWIKDIFEDLELAEKLSNEKDKYRMQLIVYEYIVDKLW